jgi:hypothetical protein
MHSGIGSGEHLDGWARQVYSKTFFDIPFPSFSSSTAPSPLFFPSSLLPGLSLPLGRSSLPVDIMSGCKNSLSPRPCRRAGCRRVPSLTTCFPTVRFLDLIKPFTPLLPEVASPETKTPFQQARPSLPSTGQC